VLEDILHTLEHENYDFVILDSIQTIYSRGVTASPGSPAQVKTCAEKISEYAKSKGICFFIVGHITKHGELAGPKYLEHIVDVVMSIE
jgi:DNA repair protein RadA/Sms